MSIELHRVLEQPLNQALALLDSALMQLHESKKTIDSNQRQQLEAVRERLESMTLDEKSREDPSELGLIISQCQHVLEAFQASKTGSNMDPIARLVAKGLAILFTAQKAAQARPLFKTAASRSVPQHIAERRASPRATVEAEIGFQSDTNFYTGFSEDISSGGIFLSTFSLRPIGDMVNVNFTLPGGHFISVDGRVRWIREYNEMVPDTPSGMGIQFENLGADDKNAIDAFVEQRATMFFDHD